MQQIKRTKSYDCKIHGYEVVFSVINLIKIPVLACFFVVSNGWLIVFYAWTFLWVFAIVLDYFLGKVIAKKCKSVFSTIIACLVFDIIFIAVATLLLFLKTGGGTFLICGDACSKISFFDGVLYMISLMGASMVIILIFAIINAIKKKKFMTSKI